MKKQDKKKKITRYFAFDVESSKWDTSYLDFRTIEHRFACLIEFNKEYKQINKHIFYTEKAFVDFLGYAVRKQEKWFVYAHNLDFDTMFFINDLIQSNLLLIPMISGRMLSLKICKIQNRKYRDKKTGLMKQSKTKRCFIEFRNTLCLFPMKLADIGADLGYPKLENDFESIDKNEITKEDIEYCYRDCEILIKALELWIKTIENFGIVDSLQNLSFTSSSVAFRIFKHKNNDTDFLGKTINNYALKNPHINKTLRKYFFGARTECFDFNLAKNVFYYDINSLYPYIMIHFKFHKGECTLLDTVIPISNKNQADYIVGYICTVDERNEEIPLIPTRDEKQQLVKFEAKIKENVFLFLEEIEYLNERKVPITFHQTLIAEEKKQNPFGYIKDIYAARKVFEKDGMNFMGSSSKILMNSTYGRFGMNLNREYNELKSLQYINTHKNEEFVSNFIKTSDKIEINSEINVMIAMKITALARLQITKTISYLRSKGVIVYYCDTDSVVCEQNDLIEESLKLGAWKKEHTFDLFQAITAKDYVYLSETNVSNFKIKGAKLRNLEDYERFHFPEIGKNGKMIGVLQARPAKLKETILNVKLGKIDEIKCNQRSFNKKSEIWYRKRAIMADLTTKPLSDETDEFYVESNEILVRKQLKQTLKEIRQTYVSNTFFQCISCFM